MEQRSQELHLASEKALSGPFHCRIIRLIFLKGSLPNPRIGDPERRLMPTAW